MNDNPTTEEIREFLRTVYESLLAIEGETGSQQLDRVVGRLLRDLHGFGLEGGFLTPEELADDENDDFNDDYCPECEESND